MDDTYSSANFVIERAANQLLLFFTLGAFVITHACRVCSLPELVSLGTARLTDSCCRAALLGHFHTRDSLGLPCQCACSGFFQKGREHRYIYFSSGLSCFKQRVSGRAFCFKCLCDWTHWCWSLLEAAFNSGG